MASCPNYKDKINSILEEIKKQIEKAVVKFEEILYSKKEGIKNNKEEWMNLYQKFKELLSIILKINEK